MVCLLNCKHFIHEQNRVRINYAIIKTSLEIEADFKGTILVNV